MSYVHLHLHTEYSLLDGMNKIKELIPRIKEMGQSAVAITDHGTLYGMVKFYKECIKHDIKPIIGLEAYVVPDKTAKTSRKEHRHLVLLAKNNKGLENIIKIASDANLNGFHYDPRTDHETLKRYGEGIIALSACLGGEIPNFLMNDEFDKAVEMTQFYKDIFDDFYLEIQAGITEKQDLMNEKIVELSNTTGVPIVVTSDPHYLYKEDFEAHDILLAVQTQKLADDPERFRFDSNAYWVKTEEETRKILMSRENLSPIVIDEAIANSVKIADMCNATITLGEIYYPDFPIPGNYTVHSYLVEQANKGLFEFAMENNIDVSKYRERLDYELNVIEDAGLSGYFLVVQDILRYANENGIATGPGRGCFAPDTLVYLSSGETKPISKISVGDKIINKFCQEDIVINKFEYDVEEEIVKLKTMYGYENIKLTSDHKILALQSYPCSLKTETNYKVPTVCTKNCSKFPCGHENICNELDWIPAGDLKLGDYVVLPKIKNNSSAPDRIDLAMYATKVLSLSNETLVIKTGLSQQNGFSVRELSKKYGISRGTLNNILDENTAKMKQSTIDKVTDSLALEGFDSINEWKIKYQEWKLSVTTNTLSRYVNIDYDFLKFIGMYIGNGYSRDSRFGIAFNSNALDDINFCQEYMSRIFNAPVSIFQGHNGKQSVQVMCNSTLGANLMNDLVPKYAINKKMPNWFIDLNREQIYAILKGLIATDGNLDKDGRIHYDSINLDLILQLRFMLLKLGIPTTIRRRKKDPSKSRPNDCYKISFRLDDLHSVDKHMQVKYYLEDDNYVYVKVLDVEKIFYSGKVYDLQIKNDPSFTTVNFVAHNSAAGCLVSRLLNITHVDPIKFNLSFQRFYVPGRKGRPDRAF